ncbi:MAG: hypothetical protein ABIJ40_16395 [Bacteroidota bacterium]
MKKIIFPTLMFVLILSQTAVTQEYKTTKSGYLAAVTEEYLNKVTKLISAKDYDALQKLIDTGYVFWLKEGLKVQVVDVKLSGKIKIRPKGQLVEVWTYREAVE